MKNLKLTATLSFLLLAFVANAQATDHYNSGSKILRIPSVDVVAGDDETYLGTYTNVQLKLNDFQVLQGEKADFSTSSSLKTQFTGKNKCLEIVNDGSDDQLIMANCDNVYTKSEQSWSVTGKQGAYRLQTAFTGTAKCLDIVNDGTNNKLIMANCGSFSGQLWSITGTQDAYRLQSAFTGKTKCLDIVNDGTNNKLIMANCANVTGQMWTVL
jgi:hypothetical protein